MDRALAAMSVHPIRQSDPSPMAALETMLDALAEFLGTPSSAPRGPWPF